MSVGAIGKFIQSRRERLGISQKDLARILDKDDSWVSRVETGTTKRMLEPDEIAKIAVALSLRESDLLKAGGYLQDEDTVDLDDPDTDFFTNQIGHLTPEQREAIKAIIRQFNQAS